MKASRHIDGTVESEFALQCAGRSNGWPMTSSPMLFASTPGRWRFGNFHMVCLQADLDTSIVLLDVRFQGVGLCAFFWVSMIDFL